MPRKAEKDKLRRLAALLIREDIYDYEDALKDEVKRDSSIIKRDVLPFPCRLYLKLPEDKTNDPWWVSFIEKGLTDPLPPLDMKKGAAAVLFLEIEYKGKRRILAYTFGYGRSLLKTDAYELNFGLRIVLNTVDPNRIKSLDIKRVEELTVHTRRETSRQAPLETFGLDVTRDFLRAATGEPRNKDFAVKVSGSDALAFSSKLEFQYLKNKTENLYEEYISDTYKERFGWIDNLEIIRDKKRIDLLNAELVKGLNKRNTEKIHLAQPEPLSWLNVQGFKYYPQEQVVHTDLDIVECVDSLLNTGEIDLRRLKKRSIYLVKEEEDITVPYWSIYDCLVYETKLNGRTYVLSGRQWFVLDSEFTKTIDSYVASLQIANIALPDAILGEHEDEYNKRAADNDESLILLHSNPVKYKEMNTQVELCDLISRDHHFIHVKRKTSSSTLSHLFAQGSRCAELLFRDPLFRQEARRVVKGINPGFVELIPNRRPKPEELKIVYAIIAKPHSNWPVSLPFFSKLNLKQNVQFIDGYGYSVSILLIEERK